MPDTPCGRTPDRFETGISQFNAGKFFECHDTLEELWQETRGPAREFLQGLIQISVGFYHLDSGNLRGCRSQFEKGLARLGPYGDSFLGLDLADLRSQTKSWLMRIDSGEDLKEAGLQPPCMRRL